MTRVSRWEQRTEWPLTGVAVVFLVAYAIPIADPRVSSTVQHVCAALVWFSWAVFVLDYGVRLTLARERWNFVKHHLLDLAVVVLPILRPLRLVRLIALLSILNRTGARALRGRVAAYAVGGTALLVISGALAITNAERGKPGANIESLGDGFWWAITTVTTVGYGDSYPVTTTGRIIAAVLMLGGIAILGVTTATIASWLVERVDRHSHREQLATRQQVQLLTREVTALADQVDALRRVLAGPVTAPPLSGEPPSPSAPPVPPPDS
jgi:voltage-gated potassium channel